VFLANTLAGTASNRESIAHVLIAHEASREGVVPLVERIDQLGHDAALGANVGEEVAFCDRLSDGFAAMAKVSQRT
jgi:hypothetical protein